MCVCVTTMLQKTNWIKCLIGYIYAIDSVLKIDKKNYPQVYLEECKYRAKKIQMSRFINTELKSDSELSDSEKIGSKFNNELIAKLENSDSDSKLMIANNYK